MPSLQTILFFAGIAFIVLAVVLAIVAIAYYVKQDIRGVMDDLSGKARQRGGMSQGSASRRSSARRRKRTPAKAEGTMLAGAEVREAQVKTSDSKEDELETVLDTKLRKVSRVSTGSNANKNEAADEVPTLVTSTDGYYKNGKPESRIQMGDEAPTQVERALGRASSTFVVTRSIISINSGEVITAG